MNVFEKGAINFFNVSRTFELMGKNLMLSGFSQVLNIRQSAKLKRGTLHQILAAEPAQAIAGS